jgi:hypothetical protein
MWRDGSSTESELLLCLAYPIHAPLEDEEQRAPQSLLIVSLGDMQGLHDSTSTMSKKRTP